GRFVDAVARRAEGSPLGRVQGGRRVRVDHHVGPRVGRGEVVRGAGRGVGPGDAEVGRFPDAGVAVQPIDAEARDGGVGRGTGRVGRIDGDFGNRAPGERTAGVAQRPGRAAVRGDEDALAV